jgi:hypothetical protein
MLGAHKIGTRVLRNSDSIPGTITEIFPDLVRDEWGSMRIEYNVALDYEISAGGVKLRGTHVRMHAGMFGRTNLPADIPYYLKG